MKLSRASKSIGILGGGQLARMMAIRAHELGMTPYVLSSSKEDPAAQVASFWIKGSPNNQADLIKIFKKVKIATVESEFFDSNVLARVGKIYPHPKMLGVLQDRLSQKSLLKKCGLTTTGFIPVSNLSDVKSAVAQFGYPVVFKKRRFGYDGYGVFICSNVKDLNTFFRSLKNGQDKQFGFIAEPFVRFKREFAIGLVRSARGQIIDLPLVQTWQKNSICNKVMGPVSHPKFSNILPKLKKFVRAIDYVGVISFELFDTGKDIIINEIAPRVHNSGHYSQDALEVDQFEYHLRAITGQYLPNPKVLAGGFAMVNLLGGRKNNMTWSLPKYGKLHWYGKNDNRRGRKMGHINCLAQNPRAALKLAVRDSKKVSL